MYHKHFHRTKEPDSKLLCFFPAAPKNFQCIMNTVFLSNSFCCPDPSISCAQISRPLFINQEWILDFFSRQIFSNKNCRECTTLSSSFFVSPSLPVCRQSLFFFFFFVLVIPSHFQIAFFSITVR